MTSSGVWEGDDERLDRALAALGLARSRSHATTLIAEGGVTLEGVTAAKPGAKVVRGTRIDVSGADHYVSRGAHKLLAALDEFQIDPAGRLALDLGASTGGFTQVLLERGAREVIALDVGHDQLVQQLRDDARVRVVEGCNARALDSETLAELSGTAEAPTVIVADLSFISLTLILPAIQRIADPGADIALLIKPQFEVGRVKHGVVSNPEQWAEAIRTVLDAAARAGFVTHGLAVSPIAGGEGNREFLVHFKGGTGANPREWDERVRELCSLRATAAADEGSRT